MELPVLKCPKCEKGRLIIRSTVRRTQKSESFPNGRFLGEVRRYRYCDHCGHAVRTTHKIKKDGSIDEQPQPQS